MQNRTSNSQSLSSRTEHICILTEGLVPGALNNLAKVLNVRFGKINTNNGQLGGARARAGTVTVIGTRSGTATPAKWKSFMVARSQGTLYSDA